MDEMKAAFNREYVRQSRIKKHKHMEDLANEISTIQSSNKKMSECDKTEVANNVLGLKSWNWRINYIFLNSMIKDGEKITGLET
ncbi:hypothetical protein CR513_62530, partial [Mucuna pruriens]